MCGSYNTRESGSNPNAYLPSAEVDAVMYQTANTLIQTPGITVPNGKFLGTHYNVSAGWCNDDETGKVIEVKARWLERGRVLNALINAHAPRKLLQYVSVAHIEPVEAEGGQKPGPYKLFFYNALDHHIDNCQYDNYEADMVTAQTFGESPNLMREQYMEAMRVGDDVLTPQGEGELIRSLRLGNMVGWQPFQTLFK